MFVAAASGALVGICARSVMVEAQQVRGLPGIALVGMARGAVKESLVRVRSALLGRGIALSGTRRVVNLVPAELPKEGSGLDMALAAVLLAQAGTIAPATLTGRRFFGELSLGGTFEAVRGGILMADLAREAGDRELLLPCDNAAEAAIIPGVQVIAIADLDSLIGHLKGLQVIKPTAASPENALSNNCAAAHPSVALGCLSDVRGQPRAKRALEIAAAGGHNLLMLGPPGSGKTMLARRLVGLLPPLTDAQRIEVTRIHASAAQQGAPTLMRHPPFRAPHHSASEPALCGGGAVPRPGEITLAHRGVLFLDELPEFGRRALEALREPLEEGCIHIARASMALRFPALVLLIAAMNPCPCGYFSANSASGGRVCLCAFEQLQRYRARVSGPLLDRIDLHVNVAAVPFSLLTAEVEAEAETSHNVRQRVLQARHRQTLRLGEGCTNSSMDAAALRGQVPLTAALRATLEAPMQRNQLSARALGRILKISRTIADLAHSEAVQPEHLEEAIGFRILDRGVMAANSTQRQ